MEFEKKNSLSGNPDTIVQPITNRTTLYVKKVDGSDDYMVSHLPLGGYDKYKKKMIQIVGHLTVFLLLSLRLVVRLSVRMSLRLSHRRVLIPIRQQEEVIKTLLMIQLQLLNASTNTRHQKS